MKVGILTYHRAVNYGAYLQACALCNRLNEEADINAEIIDYHMCKEMKKYSYHWSLPVRMRHPMMYQFLKKRERSIKSALNDSLMIRSAEYCQSDSLDDFVEFVYGRYDAIVVGSDEIWNFNNFRGFPNPYWLIGDLGCRKLSYAASSRQDFSELSAENQNRIKESLLQFDFIGVRDQLTRNEIKKLVSEKEVYICSDPTFLYDFSFDKKSASEILRDRKGYNANKPNALIMSDDKSLNRYIYKELKKDYNLISVASYNPQYINIPDLTPIEWINIINCADIFFTTYFHGSCFGIITHRPFLSFGSKSKSSKVGALLLDNGFEENYIDDSADFIRHNALSSAIKKLTDQQRYSEYEQKCVDYIDRSRADFSDYFMNALRGKSLD